MSRVLIEKNGALRDWKGTSTLGHLEFPEFCEDPGPE